MGNSKAGNLTILSSIAEINVPRFTLLNPGMSGAERRELVSDFLSTLPCGSSLAVRSSADHEDSAQASFAGMYLTKLHVKANIDDVLQAAKEVMASGNSKEDVISHYTSERNVECTNGEISVVVQEMIASDKSGVIFSHDPIQEDGYYLVSVSQGIGENIVGGKLSGMLFRVVRGLDPSCVQDIWLRQVIQAMHSIERKYSSTNLDVEFGFSRDTLYIFQCRPIATMQETDRHEAHEQDRLARLDSLNASIACSFKGDVLGDMIDINPRELLGALPTPLDISIFNYLFADRIVERVRRSMGYDPLDIGLLRVVAGKPYASLRATAFSFRPFGISYEIYERMVAVYRNALLRNPAVQSRVEFDLYAMSCGDKLEAVMAEAHLDQAERSIVRSAFQRIDSAFLEISRSQSEIWGTSAQKYEEKIATLEDASLSDILEHVSRGTEMFVRVARLAFYWKNKFDEMYPKADLNELIAGTIETIGSQLQADLVACRNNIITREELVRRYGHLRPGQFGVFSESYADDPETYLFAHISSTTNPVKIEQRHSFEGIIEFENVITFMQARERIKFLFTKALYLFSTKLKRILVERGVSEKDASGLSWQQLNNVLSGSTIPEMSQSEESPILLPDVLVPGVTDLKVVRYTEAMPSYITTAIVKARVRVLDQPNAKVDVRGALVLLPNSDPGYDFLFHSGASGIITKVGGPASHMCIRALELQMPSCIGCGESMYQTLASATTAVLDCKSRQIIVLD